MDRTHRLRLEHAVSEVLDRPPDERRALLDAAFRGEPELARAAHDLLTAHDRAGDFLEDLRGTFDEQALLGVVGTAAAHCTAPPPAQIGPYRVCGLLGRGAMGTVYLADDERHSRRVAIKVVNDTPDHRLRGRLHREGRLLSRLSHPNVVAILDVVDLGDSPALVMELVEGRDLAELIRQGGMPVRQAVEVARQTAAGLAAAHEAGVIHRDLRAGNVTLTADGQVKILDFGIARSNRRATGPEESSSAGFGHVMGAAATISPEQVRGLEAGPAADVFAFGCLLYQLLTGIHPFAATSIILTMKKVLEVSPPPVGDVNPAAPRALGEAVAALLDKDPARRPTAASAERLLAKVLMDIRPVDRE